MASIDLSFADMNEVQDYMQKRLGFFTDVMGWTTFTGTSGPLYEAAVDAVLEMGTDDLEDISEWEKFRAICEYFAWTEVVNNSGAFYDYSADSASYSRSQLQEMASDNMITAMYKAQEKGASIGREIVVLQMDYQGY